MNNLFPILGQLLTVLAVAAVVILVLVMLAGMLITTVPRDQPTLDPDICAKCGYSRKGLPRPDLPCPECGAAATWALDQIVPETTRGANMLLWVAVLCPLAVTVQWVILNGFDPQWVLYVATPQWIVAWAVRSVRPGLRRSSFRLVGWPTVAIGLGVLLYLTNGTSMGRWGVLIGNAHLVLVLLLLFGLFAKAAAYTDARRVNAEP